MAVVLCSSEEELCRAFGTHAATDALGSELTASLQAVSIAIEASAAIIVKRISKAVYGFSSRRA
jgi:hypothetical protein